jgi:hypothetical protein
MDASPPELPPILDARAESRSSLRWDFVILCIGIFCAQAWGWCASHGQYYLGLSLIDGVRPAAQNFVVWVGSPLGMLVLISVPIPIMTLRAAFSPSRPAWKNVVRLLFGFFLSAAPILAMCIPTEFPGDHYYAEGFSKRMGERIDPTELQSWATTALNKFERGELRTIPKGSNLYFSPARIEIAPEGIPAAFRALNAPSVGIRTNVFGNPDCIVFSWYEVGIYVGSTNWIDRRLEDWRVKTLQPGVSVIYHNYK